MKRPNEAPSWAWSVPPSHWLMKVSISPSSAASARSRLHLGSWHRVLLGWCSAGGRAGGLLGVLLLAGVGEAVGDGAGLDDLPSEGQPVDDRGAEPRIGEGLGPAGERLVGGDGDRRAFLPLSENLEQQFGAAAVQFHVAQLVQADQIDPAVAGDQLGQLPLIGGLDQLV